MKIIIAGYGVLGKAHEAIFKNIHNLFVADPLYNGKVVSEFTNDAEAVICCVSTPQGTDGACEMKNVFEVVQQTKSHIPIIIRSTISLDGWDILKETFPHHSLTFAPEFLRANSAEQDMRSQTEMYIGGDDVEFWKGVYIKALLNCDYISVDAKDLIAAKYFRNSFLATKVSFFNQVFDFCKAKGLDYNVVSDVVANDVRIGHSHTNVTPARGFGGHCFPKDISAILHTADKSGVDLSLIRAAVVYNKKVRTTDDK